MRRIGRIDRRLFADIAEHIVTDEVVLTDEREAHIGIQRGEGALERYAPFFRNIIEESDFILKDGDKPNTAIAVKRIEPLSIYLAVILRLATPEDGSGVDNYIITAIPQGEKRFVRTLRTNPPIYICAPKALTRQ